MLTRKSVQVTEETGFPCRLLYVDMFTRAPSAVEEEQLGDKASFYTSICEPFTLQIRRIGDDDIKLI